MSTKIRNIFQSMLYYRASKHMEEGGALVQSIWTVYLHEIARCAADVERRRGKQNIEALTQYGFKTWNWGTGSSGEPETVWLILCSVFKTVHLFVSRSGFVKGGYTPCLKDYVEKWNFICVRTQFRQQVQRLFSKKDFGRERNREIFCIDCWR